VKFMTAEQQRGQVATTEAPAIRDIEAHTSEDHRAARPETPNRKGAQVTAPFQEAASLPAPSLKQQK
jgi:hypothetical protein